ncbi:uncharacterized protein LOC133514048 isoform X1 [Syngnathoides biaculeatus]|uniref:uncharacterized protein LOC133514048 isoform X1 n=1 Tax=Syngnathoides biaculeatus TaxID=300417 RepID=UPI002ADDC11D|nr:uncharacterized protein LOC133514048 isoform X1 [Syngnathoides biaculeatus]
MAFEPNPLSGRDDGELIHICNANMAADKSLGKLECPSIHPFSEPLILTRVAGVLEPTPPVIGQEAGYTLNWLPASRKAHGDRQQLHSQSHKHFDHTQRELNHPEKPLKWNAVPNIFAHTKKVAARRPRKQRVEPDPPKFWNELDHPYAQKYNCGCGAAELSVSDNNMADIIKAEVAAQDVVNPVPAVPAPPTITIVPLNPDDQIRKLQAQNLILQRKLRYEQRLRRSIANERSVMQEKMMMVFNNNQLENMSKKSSCSFKWSMDTYRKALKLRNACGKTGYDELLRQGYPLPSLRSLRRKDVVSMESQIQEETLKTSSTNDNERDCSVALDETAIVSDCQNDKSSCSFREDATPGSSATLTQTVVLVAS